MSQLENRKIVHLTSVHVPFDNRIFEKMCQSGRDFGMRVVLVARHENDTEVDGIRLRAVNLPGSRVLRALLGSIKVCLAGYREDGDLYQIHDPELLPGSVLLRLLGKTVIYDMHENVPKAIVTKHWIPAPLRKMISLVWRLFERVMMWRMPVIFAEHSYPADYPWVKNQQVVLNMPKLEVLFSINEQKRPDFTLAYLGAIAPERGSRTMVQAVVHLQEQGISVGLHAIGRMSEEHKLELERLSSQQSARNIEFEGFMRPAQAWQKIAACQVGVAVLAPIPNYIESYPTKIFEYMALGLPVIVSDFPLYRKIVEEGQCGLCVEPENPQKLADAVSWLITHPQEAAEMGVRGRALVEEKYSWSFEQKKLAAFYESCVEQA